jgi:hypothetical protein
MRLFAIGFVCVVPVIANADPGAQVATADPAPATNPAAASTPASTAPNATVAPAPAPVPPADDGTRLRNGFSASIGEETGSGPSSGLSGQLYGVDWRIGAHLSGPFSVYADTHLSLGTAKIGGTGGATGNFAFAVVGEAELPARTFVAGGAGYGVLNNPSGPLLQARAGWYPFAHDATRGRRLDVAIDARFYFAGDAIGTVSQIALTLGYDAF